MDKFPHILYYVIQELPKTLPTSCLLQVSELSRCLETDEKRILECKLDSLNQSKKKLNDSYMDVCKWICKQD